MSRRYDSRTTIFSPEGRLYQVEYALEAINHAGTSIGIMTKEGIVLIAERKITSKLLKQDSNAEKIYVLSNNAMCSVAGMTADASILVNYIRENIQEYLKVYNIEPTIENLVKNVCNFKQSYTQFGGLRPFGVSFLFAGYDNRFGFQLYNSNPSGNYSGWKAISIGSNSSSAQTLLKQEYTEDITLEEAKKLAIKVLSKTTDSTRLNSEKIEFATVTRKKCSHSDEDETFLQIWSPKEIDALLDDCKDILGTNEEDDEEK